MISEDPHLHRKNPDRLSLGFDANGRPCGRDGDLMLHLRSSDNSEINLLKGRTLLSRAATQIAALGHCVKQDVLVVVNAQGVSNPAPTVSVSVFSGADGSKIEGAQLHKTSAELKDRLEAVFREARMDSDFSLHFEMKSSLDWPEDKEVNYQIDLEHELGTLRTSGDCTACKVIRGEASPEMNITCMRAQATDYLGRALATMSDPPLAGLATLKRAAVAAEKYYPPPVRLRALHYLSSHLRGEDAAWLGDLVRKPIAHFSGFGREYDSESSRAIQAEVCKVVRNLIDRQDPALLKAIQDQVAPALFNGSMWFGRAGINPQVVSRVARTGVYRFNPKHLDSQFVATLAKILRPSMRLLESPN